jgi:predicted ATPase
MLPASTTRFLGRSRELVEIVGLATDRARLVTLTGTGGVGKTRLAREAALLLLKRYAGEAYVVELAPLRDPGSVAAAIAQALGRTHTTDEPVAAMLRRRLRE